MGGRIRKEKEKQDHTRQDKMVDPDNLRTASLYINNQLLSRGLLRDGNNINFADPESGDGGVQGTMGKVMSVINDLILRRDVSSISFPAFYYHRPIRGIFLWARRCQMLYHILILFDYNSAMLRAENHYLQPSEHYALIHSVKQPRS